MQAVEVGQRVRSRSVQARQEEGELPTMLSRGPQAQGAHDAIRWAVKMDWIPKPSDLACRYAHGYSTAISPPQGV